jgi:hypothetical protein
MFITNERSITLHFIIQSIIIIIFAYPWIQFCSEHKFESYFHSNAIIAVPPLSHPTPSHLSDTSATKPLSSLEACRFAIHHLEKKGIKNIVICEVQWIAAPLSGYLVDLKGNLTIEGQDYSIFRIGITDSFEKYIKKTAGDEFVFIAYNKNKDGKTFWYPKPGPDSDIFEENIMSDNILVYEFLLQRERFETLFERYP